MILWGVDCENLTKFSAQVLLYRTVQSQRNPLPILILTVGRASMSEGQLCPGEERWRAAPEGAVEFADDQGTEIRAPVGVSVKLLWTP